MSLYLLFQNTSLVKLFYEPIFKDHLLQPQHEGAIFNPASQLYWPTIVLFLALSTMVILKATMPLRTLRVLNAAYSLQVARQIERENYSPFKNLSILLSIVFVLILSFLLYKFNRIVGGILMEQDSLLQFFFFVGLVIIAYALKFTTLILLGHITKTSAIINDYILNTLIINQSVGVVLLPVMIFTELSTFNPVWLVFPSILFIVLGYFFRLYRGFLFAGIEHGVQMLQLFVYLCTLEILPLLVLIKFLVVKF